MRLIIPFLFICGLLSAQPKAYRPFPEDSALWVVGWGQQNNNPVARDLYIMHGDTLINGISYNKLYRERNIWNPQYFTVLIPYAYLGGIRQDSLNKKVYFIGAAMTADTILYDFNLSIGDTLQPTFLANGLVSGMDTVWGIDSLSYYPNPFSYYKKFNFSPGGTMGNLVEGLGSDCGLFEIYFHFEGGPGLACFKEHNISAYDMSYGPAHPLYSPCSYYFGASLPLGASSESKQSIYVDISPNPSNGIYFIQSSENILEVDVVSVIGEKVYSVQGNASKIEIDLRDYHDGIYFLQLKTSQGIVNKKIILQK